MPGNGFILKFFPSAYRVPPCFLKTSRIFFQFSIAHPRFVFFSFSLSFYFLSLQTIIPFPFSPTVTFSMGMQRFFTFTLHTLGNGMMTGLRF
ncbi:hypothetical protein HanRHA438_Chr10g0473491 [Helianthus annuus]|nr:hypothetical protein HanRHA438_Chr10g0473491 [Helianthus annuus]